jgi:hypothetical protein
MRSLETPFISTATWFKYPWNTAMLFLSNIPTIIKIVVPLKYISHLLNRKTSVLVLLWIITSVECGLQEIQIWRESGVCPWARCHIVHDREKEYPGSLKSYS